MAHNINFNNSKHSFFSVKERAWHGLGQLVNESQTSEQAIKLAGLDYEVKKEPIYLSNGEIIPGSFATVRQDNKTPLGVVKSRYEVLQNVNAFDFFDSIVGKGEAIYETAGVLGKGETIFITAKLPDYIRVGKEDLIEQYIFLTNSHDGSKPITAAFTPIRIVCNNTLNAALRTANNKITIRHTANLNSKLNEAHKLMGIVNLLKQEMEQVFNAMAKKPCVDSLLKEIIVKTFASDAHLDKMGKNEDLSTRFQNIVSDVYAYAMSSNTQQMETTRGTMFGAYNAITGYIQNVKSSNQDDKGKFLNSILNGTDFNYTQKAFDLCLQEI